MTIKEPTIAELTESGKITLCREFGVVNAIRFLQGYAKSHGNYTKERESIYQDIKLQEILEKIKAKRA